jgi:hypothetical protein
LRTQTPLRKVLEELEVLLDVEHSDRKEETPSDEEQVTSGHDGLDDDLVDSERMQHFDEDAIKSQHAAINKRQHAETQKLREVTRKAKEHAETFDLDLTAQKLVTLGINIAGRFSEIDHQIQNLISLYEANLL